MTDGGQRFGCILQQMVASLWKRRPLPPIFLYIYSPHFCFVLRLLVASNNNRIAAIIVVVVVIVLAAVDSCVIK